MALPPVLPYGSELPTSGWSGSESSQGRALYRDSSGLTNATQNTALEMLSEAGSLGMTWAEMSEATGLHHGTVSGALSNLQKAGLITRLVERRAGSQVYVRLEYLDGRQEAPYRPNGTQAPPEPARPAGGQPGGSAAPYGTPRQWQRPVETLAPLGHLARPQPDRQAQAVWLGYRDVIEEAIASTPRSLQVAIGPSEVGNSCQRCLVEKLGGRREPSQRGFDWLPFVGSAVHAALAEVFVAANAGLERARYLVESRVDVGTILGQPVTGSADLYDVETADVTDWKVVGVSTLAAVKAAGPSDVYRAQVHLYGRGFARRGLPVRQVRIAYLPRNETHLGNAVIWSEPYSEAIAVAALERAETLATGISMLGMDAMRAATRHNGLEFSCARYDPALSVRPHPFADLVAS